MSRLADLVSMRCACGAKLSAPITSVGCSSNCPKCGSVLTVPSTFEVDLQLWQADSRLGRGILYSGISAVILGTIWVTVAAIVNGEVAIFAWIMGLACAFGMLGGTVRRSIDVGLIAAIVALLAIVLAKAAVFVMLLDRESSLFAGRILADPELSQQVLVDFRLKEATADPANAGLAPDELLARSRQLVQGMLPSERTRYIEEYNKDLIPQANASARQNASSNWYLGTMYSGFDILFIAAGMLTALTLPMINDRA